MTRDLKAIVLCPRSRLIGAIVGFENDAKAVQILREMGNPIESILNLLYLIHRDSQDTEEVLRYAELAESQARCLV